MIALKQVVAALGLLSLMAGCRPAETTVPTDAATTVISLQGIDCDDCGDEVAQAIEARPEVFRATFDKHAVELMVAYDATSGKPADFVGVARAAGYEAVEGAGHGAYLEGIGFPEGADVVTLAHGGEDVEIAALLAPGKVTVVDFYAEWCKPCREVDEHLARQIHNGRDLALRKVDIVDWDTPVTKHHLANVPNLPYVVVYDKHGKKVDGITGLDLKRLDAALEKAGR